MKLRNKETGEIWDIGKILTNDYPSYDTLESINEDFEDYEPKVPLIKDEKVRKAVRAWAEALDLRWFRRCSSTNFYTSRLSGHNAEGVCYTMELAPSDLYGEKITKDSHTLAELCGEEEE